MGVRERRDRNGSMRVYVDRRWPDGRRFLRVVPNKTVGKRVLARIEESIAMGTWREFRKELSTEKTPRTVSTIADVAEKYMAFCESRNRRPDFKRQALTTIVRHFGEVKIEDFNKVHAIEFIERRRKHVAPATVNRGLAVLKHMLNFCVANEWIPDNPLRGFSLLPEPERALRVMTLEEERHLVDCVARCDLTIGAMVALLGETALRKSEGLRLRWQDIDARSRILTVGESKSGKVRYVPLTAFALQWLGTLNRIVGVDHVFIRENRNPWKDPRGPFEAGRDAAGLDWVKGFHDLRHFRATQWVRNGMDIRTVQELLGHSNIRTTMRYSHFDQSHAIRSVHEVEEVEKHELDLKRNDLGTIG